ncbi:hypothetical protein FI667_g16504, partial [Globisporangium splendens]
MKTTAVLAFAAIAAATANAIDIPAEHHQRFLREQASIAEELAQWKDSVAGQVAKKNGYYKEAQSDDTVLNDEYLKRFFLTKLSIAEAEKANPEATFSVNTPFTLMTDEEFAHLKATCASSLPRWTGPRRAVSPVSRTKATAARAGHSRRSVCSSRPTA